MPRQGRGCCCSRNGTDDDQESDQLVRRSQYLQQMRMTGVRLGICQQKLGLWSKLTPYLNLCSVHESVLFRKMP